MDINQIDSRLTYRSIDSDPNGQTNTEGERADKGTMISSDFETFLKMLTVQMENQDPLNPIESSDYAVQLATFSGVEQQVRTNDLLSMMQSQLGVMGMTDLAGWVGMEARATVPAEFELAPVSVTPTPAEGATQTFMVVRNAGGLQVDRLEIPVGTDPVEWAGLDDNGNLFPQGAYSFFLQSYDANGLISEDQMAVYSEIVEAKVEGGETVLVLESGDEIPATSVDALRAPDT